MSENIDKVRTVAEYMGCRVNAHNSNIVYLAGEDKPYQLQPIQERFALKYNTSIEWLYPVAGKVVAELRTLLTTPDLIDEIPLFAQTYAREAIFKANNEFDIAQLFEATVAGIKIIDKFKKERNGK